MASGLGDFVTTHVMDDCASVALTSTVPHAELRAQLALRGWIEDPLPRLRATAKPWVLWSIRERHAGVALHVEDMREGLRVHVDVLSPGRWWILFPLHLMIDFKGWRTVRMSLLRWIAERRHGGGE